MRMGTIMACMGVVLLALPIHLALTVGVGIALFSFGTTLPYAAVFSEAGRVGKRSGLGTGTAQGVVSLLSAPASSLGPPIIGLLLQREGNFSLALGALALVGLLAIPAALLAGPVLTRAWKTRSTAGPATREPNVYAHRLRDSERLDPDRELRAALATLKTTVSHPQQLPAAVRPVVVMPGFLSLAGDEQRMVFDTDALTLQRLLEVGGMPVILPVPPLSFQHGKPPDLPVGEDVFRRLFDEVIWPFFCQMLFQHARGVCLIECQHLRLQKGVQKADGQPFYDEVEVTGMCRRVVFRSLVMLAALIGMPVLGGEKAIQRDLQVRARTGEDAHAQAQSFRAHLPASSSPSMDKDEEALAAFSRFVAACNACTPLPPDALSPLQAPIYSWLRRRQRTFLRQTSHLQTASGQEAGGIEQGTKVAVAPGSRASVRLRARQQKLRTIRGTASSPGKTGTASAQAWRYVSGGRFAAVQS
jgi:hypothetical protein